MLGPLAVEERKTNAAPAVLDDLNAAQFRSAFPNAFQSPELRIARDPVREEEEHEQRIAAVWMQFAPETFRARQRLTLAELKHRAAFDTFKARERDQIEARNAWLNAGDEVVGERDDRRSRMEICKGFEQVAQHNLDLAQEELDAARAQLAEAVKR